MAAHYGEGEGVERAHLHLLRLGQPGRDAGAHLVCGATGERQGENAHRADVSLADKVRDPFDQHSCLAGAWSSEHEQRAAGMLDGLALRVVEILASHHPPSYIRSKDPAC